MSDVITLNEQYAQYIRLLDRARRAWPATDAFQVSSDAGRVQANEIAAHIERLETAIAGIEESLKSIGQQ
jgi:hypothetical protein